METVIFDETPLAAYLDGEGGQEGGQEHPQPSWSPPAEADQNVDTPPPSPPTPSFAPSGKPLVNKRFRNLKPDPLRLQIPSRRSLSSTFRHRYSKAFTSRIDRRDSAKFIEQFRYTIVASQLLSGHTILGPHQTPLRQSTACPTKELEGGGSPPLTSPGLGLTIAGAATLAWALSWLASGGFSSVTKKRFLIGLLLFFLAAGVGQFYIRRRWLQYVREQALSQVAKFVLTSQDLDGAISAAVALTQEVELVSRGYRISVPLPPVSRMDERSQSRRCGRLRRALRIGFQECVPQYKQTCDVVKAFSEQTDLEKYYDIYDISDFDISDALQGFSDAELEDPESLKTFKIVAARFHTLRKMLLCTLLALEARGDQSDFMRWATVAEGLRALNQTNSACYERLAAILREEESFPMVSTPKMPLSPGSERWRSQLRKLNSLSAGIRGLQAKLALLREESNRSLNEASDVSELGPSLVAQYDSIGQDLKMLTQTWEEGKAALASGIDRNEKRLSSMSSLLLSPTVSTYGGGRRSSMDEGGSIADALRALNGDSPSPAADQSASIAEAEEVFEAVAMPRPRSVLTREERLAKMKADREKRAEAKESADNGRFMLRELETVLSLKAKPLQLQTPRRTSAGRVSL